MSKSRQDEIRQSVRESYGNIARQESADCGCPTSGGCCPGDAAITPESISTRIGYSQEEVEKVPEGANLGLGCGNPQAIAALKSGEVVLDLGSGGGFDCFLAADQVGAEGSVIGLDMTPDMISKARKNAEKGGFENVDFRLGEIEHLPVADAKVDVILSNCVINLSPDKPGVYREAYRVLKPGGRLAISDVVATAELPDEIKNDLALHSACIAGAETIEELQRILAGVGFENIRIQPKDESKEFIREWVPGGKIEDYVASATVEAVKPKK